MVCLDTDSGFKALVLACGIRKQWYVWYLPFVDCFTLCRHRKKVFDDCATETAQITRLKFILTDLGMKGRMSMDQAKAIRKKRELKAELGNPRITRNEL